MLTCVGCGCTDLNACQPPCWWAKRNPPICSTCDAAGIVGPGSLLEDLRTVAVAIAPAALTVAQALVGPGWSYLRDRQLARSRRRLRPAAVVALTVVDALHRRGRDGWPGCPPACSEGHTYTWPCELAPVLPSPASDDGGHAEADPTWWASTPDSPTDPDEDQALRSWGDDPPDHDQALRSPLA